MTLIEQQDFAGFTKYLDETNNTICGRNPIQLLLAIIEEAKKEGKIGGEIETKFVQYAQSEPVKDKNASSVSYASSYTVIKQ